MASDFVHRLAEVWWLDGIVSRLDRVAGGLQKFLIELVVRPSVPKHQFQILLDILRGECRWCRCSGVEFLEDLCVEDKWGLVNEGHLTICNGCRGVQS